jgi:hypothetical protein
MMMFNYAKDQMIVVLKATKGFFLSSSNAVGVISIELVSPFVILVHVFGQLRHIKIIYRDNQLQSIIVKIHVGVEEISVVGVIHLFILMIYNQFIRNNYKV